MKYFNILFSIVFALSIFLPNQTIASSSIYGQVADSAGIPVQVGAVAIIKKLINDSTPFAVVDTGFISNGSFFVSGLQPGIYLLKAFVPSDNRLLPTFYGNAVKWFNAQQITVSLANDTVIANIMMHTMPVWNPGNGKGKCFGKLTYENGPGKIGPAAGGPIPGVNVSLEQIPGGIMAKGTTDVSGSYVIPNIPKGTTYKIMIDIPGLNMFSTITLTTTATDTIFPNINFGVDTTSNKGGIFALSTTTGLFEISDQIDIKIFPNPTSKFLNITIFGSTKNVGNLRIYDINGKLMIAKNRLNYSNKIDVSKFANGIYFVELNVDKKTISKKIIIKK